MRCASARPTARCSRNGPTGTGRPVGARRRAPARPQRAIRCWRGSTCAMRRSPPRSTNTPTASTAPASTERRARNKIIAWTFAATVSLVFVAVVVLPALVERLAPLIPLSVEHRLGAAVDAQVRAMLDTGKSEPAVRMRRRGRREGRPRRARQADRPAGDAPPALPIPIKTAVVRRKRSQRHRAAGRPYLRLRGPGRRRAKRPTSWPA